MSTTVLEEDIEAPNGKTFTPFVPRPPSPTIHAVTSSLRGLEDAVLTVRVIKSFPYRTMKALVLPHVDLTAPNGVSNLIDQCKSSIKEGKVNGFRAFKAGVEELDTLKLYTKAHGSKTMNLIINLTNDETEILPLDTAASLASFGIENEHELSLFNRKAYEAFKLDPETKWDP